MNQFTSEKLPLVNLTGDPAEIGSQHGTLLKKRVIKVLDFYKKQFRGKNNRSDDEIFSLAEQFKTSIKAVNIDYTIEIEAIAKAVEVDPLWIYALNARSELMNKFYLQEELDQNECTALYFQQTKLLGQNWDWARELEDLVVLTRIEQEKKPTILMMTEPGIIGKIGFNDKGIGVLLNFLHIDGYAPYDVPTHILLRAVLDSSSITTAKKVLQQCGKGRTSNIIVGDRFGQFLDIEFAGDEYFLFEPLSQDKTFELPSDVYLHTNHYLGKQINTDPVEYASSFARYNRGQELLATLPNQSISSMKSILLDKENTALPICRKYTPSVSGFLSETGTICSIIMDLEKLEMQITKGSPLEHSFINVPL